MTLCGFEIAPGEKRQVKLPVPGGAPLEAWLLCGAHPGIGHTLPPQFTI